MKDIYLHGDLARFGEHFSLDVRDPKEAIHAISVQLKGFREAIEAGHWHIFRGPLEDEDDLDLEDVGIALGNAAEVHIMPAIEGAGGVFQTLAGVSLFAVGVFTGNPALLYAGGALAIGGVTQMLTSPPKVGSYSDRERPGERPSFLFDGPVNTSTQGLPVPLIYGRMRVGSVVISAGITAEDIPIEDDN